MNNTPRTDAAVWGDFDVVEASFARQLERELAAVTEQLKETRKHLKDANRGAEINAHALRITKKAHARAQLKKIMSKKLESLCPSNAATCSGSSDVPPLPADQRPADWWKQPVPRGVCPCCSWKTKITKVRWQQTNRNGKKEWYSYHTCRANRCTW